LTPANFSIELPRLCIELLSYQGDLVLDIFSGSGKTAKACIETRRNYIGCEINPEYVNIAKREIKRTRPKPKDYRNKVQKKIVNF